MRSRVGSGCGEEREGGLVQIPRLPAASFEFPRGFLGGLSAVAAHARLVCEVGPCSRAYLVLQPLDTACLSFVELCCKVHTLTGGAALHQVRPVRARGRFAKSSSLSGGPPLGAI